MAFYGSASANLSPILFKGNLFSEGVNILMHSDVSLSMSIPSNGTLNYRTLRPSTSDTSALGVGYTFSPFYDGLFPAYLQRNLVRNKVGDSARSPNIFGYFDSTVRSLNLTSRQTLTENTESYEFTDSLIIGVNGATLGNLRNSTSDFIGIWNSRYINNVFTLSGGLKFSASYPFDVAAKQANSTSANRLSGADTARSEISTNEAKLSYYSEDVHGNILSLYYSGFSIPSSSSSTKVTGVEITNGDITKSHFGSDLYKIPRRRLPTYFITASNEQSNAANNAIGVGFTTKINVGYSTDKYGFNSTGLYIRRYRGSIGQTIWNSECVQQGGSSDYSSEIYKNWFESTAVPLPLGSDDTGIDENAPGINWFNNGLVFGSGISGFLKFSQKIQGTPQVPYYNSTGSGALLSYNYDPNYPLGTVDPYSFNNDKDFQDVYVPTTLQNRITYSAQSAASTTNLISVTQDNKIGAFWGPVNAFDRVRSDIQSYTLMSVGYFRAPASGLYKFKLITCGVCSLWISSDRLKQPSGGGWSDATRLTDDKVYSDWNIGESTLSAPNSSSDRYRALHDSAFRDIVWGDGSSSYPSLESNWLELTEGRYYPFRIVFSKPNGNGNDFSLPNSAGELSCDNSVLNDDSNENPGFFRLLFTRALTNPSNTDTPLPIPTDSDWNIETISGNNVFFGGIDVWKPGSPFFPNSVPQNTITKTIKEEINDRNLRVISLSSYDSNDGYDGIFYLKKPNDPQQLYRYINLRSDNYSVFESNSQAPTTWRFKNYFTPINYTITPGNYTNILGSQGENAVLNISRLNDRYLTTLGNPGDKYKIGDRIRVNRSQIGGSLEINDLLLEVNQVIPQIYTQVEGTILGSTRTDNASFFVSKNENGDSTPEYSITLNPSDAGSNYLIGDELIIPGSSLDGQNTIHDLTFKVTSVAAGTGEITGIGLADGKSTYGSPTSIIGYTITPSTFDPIPYSSIKFYTQDCNIYYRHQTISGIAYTAASITGISYTTISVTGAAYSSFSISGIAYTTASITGISYSTASITGIAYTVRDVIGVGYSASNITGIAYTTANVVSIGYNSASVTAIGYTSPQVVSIGYTAFQVQNISYPDALSISNIEDVNGPDDDVIVTISTPLVSGISTILTVGDFVIISNSGYPDIDGRREVTTVTNPDTIRITPASDLGSFNVSPTEAKFIPESSSALLRTTANHTFNANDSIIIRGVTKPQYTDWNSTFVVNEIIDSTSITLNSTGTVGLFTGTTLGEEVGAGLTVGYDQSELQLEIVTPVPYQLEVGMGITVFGIEDESSIYNNGYTIQSILESDGSGPYKFDLLQNQTPTELALPGTTGRVGIHTISGIATVTSTSEFGLEGDIIDLKIENSTSQFFNKVFNGATIINGTNILLGSNSHRDLNTPNPDEYSKSDNNVSGSTLSGRLGSNLKIAYNSLTPGYTLKIGDQLDVYGTQFHNTLPTGGFSYTIQSISGSDLFVDTVAGVTTTFSNVSTNGTIGVRGLGPIVTTSTSSGLSTNFGPLGSTINVKFQGTSKEFLNTGSFEARIVGTNQILVPNASNPFNRLSGPSNYDPQVGGASTVGFVGSRLRVRTSTAHGFNNGDQIRLQNVLDQFGNSATFNGTYTVLSTVDSTTFDTTTSSTVSTNYGFTGYGGISGLIANARVTTSSNHPFVTGNTVKIQDTSNNNFNRTYTIINTGPTSFILNDTSGTSPISYTSDFLTANSSNGIVGLLNYPATVTYTTPSDEFIFETGQKIQIENVNNTYGQATNKYTITKVTNNSFTLGINAIDSTNISITDSSGLIGLSDVEPKVTYTTKHRIINTNLNLKSGDQVKIQNSGNTNLDGNVYTIKLYQNGTPVDTGTFGLIGAEKSSSTSVTTTFINQNVSTGIGGLVGSRLRIRTGTAHGLNTGNSVRIQGTQSAIYDGNSSITILAATTDIFDLNSSSFISNNSTNFVPIELSTSSARIGPHGYPAIATFSSALPNSFVTGSQVKIEGSTTYFNTNQVYTITRYPDNTRIALQESVIGNTNPTSITFVESESLYAGLRDSPPRLNVGTTTEFGSVGNVVSVDVSELDSFFNGVQNARITSATTFDLIQKTNPDSNITPIPYNLNAIDVTGGVIGLRDASRVVSVPTGHGLQNPFTFYPGNQIYIRSTNGTYSGTFEIENILDLARFTIDDPSITIDTKNPTNYTIQDTGYYVGVGSGARVVTTRNHVLNARVSAGSTGDWIIVNDNEDDYDGGYEVGALYSNTEFSLFNTYPANPSGFDFKKATVSGNIVPIRPSGSTSAQIKINRNINGTYTLVSGDFITNGGNRYRTGQRYVIKGGKLGGVDSTNDLLFTVGSQNGGVIVYNPTNPSFNVAPTISGIADNTLDYSIDGVFVPKESSDNPSTGSGARFTIVKNGQRNLNVPIYTSVEVTSTGSLYQTNDKIRILGTELGGLTPQNDLYVVANTVSSGQIPLGSTGIAYTGISLDSYGILGFSTIYRDGTTDLSRPFGLEKVWDHTLDGSPPSEGGFLSQKHDMISLAAENYGGVIKIDKVFNIGQPEKTAFISSCFFYGYKFINDLNESTVIFDQANTGLCRIFLDNDGDDDQIFFNIIPDVDRVFVFNYNDGAGRFGGLDYTNVGYAHTVIEVQSAPDTAEGGSSFTPSTNFSTPVRLDIDYITIRTLNDNVISSHNRISSCNVELIKASSPLIIVSNNHPFTNGDTINLYLTTDSRGLLYESVTGLGFTSYRVVNSNTNTIQLEDFSGNLITAGTIAPNGKPLVEYVYGLLRSAGGFIGPNGENESPFGNDSRSAFTRFYAISSGGRVYSVGTGIPPVDNRIGLTKAIADFISQTSKRK